MDSVKASIARPTYRRLMAARARLKEQKGRNVSVSETLDDLMDRAGEPKAAEA